VIPLSNKLSRAIRKFRFKYGFDPHLYADGWALGLNREELAEFLGVDRCFLDKFFADQDARKDHVK